MRVISLAVIPLTVLIYGAGINGARCFAIKILTTMKKYSILFDDGQSLILEAESITALMTKVSIYDYNENGILSITIIK